LIYSFDIAKPRGARYWRAFLENERSFRYEWRSPEGVTCSFSGIKEKRSHQSGVFYVWIAHKRVGGRLRRRYLGANRNLTVEKLRKTAREIG
jgi:hypothetical protein